MLSVTAGLHFRHLGALRSAEQVAGEDEYADAEECWEACDTLHEADEASAREEWR